VDRIVRNTSGIAPDAVDQPSPMPQGVSNLAVGAALPSTPEPASWAAAIVMLAMLGLLLRRRASCAELAKAQRSRA
jgi:Ca-activated chloride channel family protein